MEAIWMWVLLLVAAYCAVQAILDFRRRRYAMGALGLVCAALVLLMPIHSRAIKLDMIEARSS